MKTQSRWLDPILAFAIFSICWLLYNATLTPGLSYASFDGNELTTVAYTLGLAHPTGYPLFTWLGFLFSHLLPLGEVAHRTNLMCATMGAGGVALLYLILRRVDLSRAVAAFAALYFGASTTFWSQAVITEVYAPNVFMLAGTVLVLLIWAHHTEARRQTLERDSGFHPSTFILLPSFALLFGLSLGTHMSNLGFAPAYALFVLLTDWRVLTRPLTMLASFVAFLLGLAQFLWIPLRGATINDPLLPRVSSNPLFGMYAYTLGAFSNLRFAFPITALPERVVVYLGYLNQNFTVVGIALGVLGAWVLLFRHPKRFWLFAAMYFIHVFFFAQYKVFDLDVFFIPSHFIFAIFVAFGAQQLLAWFHAARGSAPARVISIAASVAIMVLLFALVALLAVGNAKANDRRGDTAIGDFYRNVFAMLPRDSVLISRRGVFGYDMYYWRAVYHARPDVAMPMYESKRARAPNAPLFTTVRVVNGQPQGGAWAPPRGALPADAWYIPVLVGNQRDLVLYRASATPPQLIAADAPSPTRVNHVFDGVTLLDYDWVEVPDAPSPRVHLKMYWRVTSPRVYLISTRVDDLTLETHDLGFGNLPRYLREMRVPRAPIVVEEYDLVLPSHLKKGAHAFRIGLAEFSPTGIEMRWVEVGSVQVR